MKLAIKDYVALAVGAMGFLGSLISAIIGVSIVHEDHRPTETCLKIYQDYQKDIAISAAERNRVLVGKNGHSILDSDPDAKYCNIKPSDFS
jgi:hypothetical protein